jgi:hypothetical protein
MLGVAQQPKTTQSPGAKVRATLPSMQLSLVPAVLIKVAPFVPSGAGLAVFVTLPVHMAGSVRARLTKRAAAGEKPRRLASVSPAIRRPSQEPI